MRVLHSTILRPLDIVFEIVKEANEWIDKQAPFKLIKESKEQTREVLGKAIGMIRFVERRYSRAPATAEEILRRYGKVIMVGEPLFSPRPLTTYSELVELCHLLTLYFS